MKEWWSFLFPPPTTCWFCNAPVQANLFAPPVKRLCPVCQEAVQPIGEPVCCVCGRNDFEETSTGVCFDCVRIHEEERVVNRSPVAYTEQVKEWMLLFKYRGKESLAVPMGQWMADVVRAHYARENISLITFVPLHGERLLQRGFNQAEKLADEVGRRLGLPVRSLLVRSRATAYQSKRSRKERLLALQGSVILAEGDWKKQVENQVILIVDDVYTTGTTIRECAKPLRQAGAKKVCSVTFAR
ncbi:ComF family protein [Laceyella putida]|uniref:ComF family protein n=1 Tax=Laceyella putida TaxID=110101 RepID=A0ABW2RGG6_9BACL